MQQAISARTPAHLWIVATLATLWNAFGCYDYWMTETRNPQYLAMAGADALAYYAAFPAWVVAMWAIGVFGGLAGSLLLLARSRLAVVAYGMSLLGLLGIAIYQFALSTPPASLATPGMWVMTVVIWAIAIGLFVYAGRLMGRRVLR